MREKGDRMVGGGGGLEWPGERNKDDDNKIKCMLGKGEC